LAASELDTLAPNAPPLHLPGAIAVWHDLLGFDELYDLKKKSSEDAHIASIKSSDHRHVELFNAAPARPSNLSHE
jgi:hypothetical protein